MEGKRARGSQRLTFISLLSHSMKIGEKKLSQRQKTESYGEPWLEEHGTKRVRVHQERERGRERSMKCVLNSQGFGIWNSQIAFVLRIAIEVEMFL